MPDPTPHDDPTFIPLSDFERPSLPAEENFRRVLGQLRAWIGTDDAKPFIAADQLKKATLNRLNEVVAPPACGPLLEELDRSVQAWLRQPARASHILPVVMPPCEESDLLQTWAQQAGHQVLQPPDRAALVDSASDIALPPLQGDGALVVPRLEDWLLRCRSGLRAVRLLLAALDALERPVLVGCNSWAWAWLARAADADSLLPEPITFRAFDQARLLQWFAELATADQSAAVRFRLPSTGENVLEQGADGKLQSDYLEKLAGRSLGIPWVAWHMWRRSMRSDKQQAIDQDEKPSEHASSNADDGDDPNADQQEAATPAPDAADGEQTLWIAALDEYVLPAAEQQTALLALHALLLHGPLTPAQLRLVLPIVGESNVLPVLVRAGFLQRDDERFVCCAAAYPAIRSALSAVGFPVGAI